MKLIGHGLPMKSLQPSPQAAAEMLKRRKLRTSLQAWCDHVLAPLGHTPAAHHRLMIAELERVARGETKRLALFLPPGSAKSTYASDLFPAWYLAQGRGRAVIAASNTADLAHSFSRRVRSRIREYGPLLGYALDREAEELWTTTNSGQYRAAGVGGVITGLRADLAIIDDPVRSREDADSETRRNRVWEWFQNDLTTRLKPGAGVVLVQTRWHEDDLAGRLLASQPQDWRVLSLPALCERLGDPLGRNPGEWLWSDDAYGYAADLQNKRAVTDARTWAALYQQQPTPDDGDYFKAEWLREYDDAPGDLHIYGASDFAVTDGGGDFTEHGIFGGDHQGNTYILDWWAGQASADVWIERMCDLILKWRPRCWFGEAGPIRRAVEPFLLRRMTERGALCRLEWMASIADKTARARSVQALASMGKFWMPRAQGASWVEPLRRQLLTFPAGKHDDGVDVCSLYGRGLEYVIVRRPAPKTTVEPFGAGGWMS